MGHEAAWSYTVTLAPLPSNVAVARGLVRDCLIEHDLPALVEDIRLVTSEFATNAITHARTPFTVGLERSDGHVRLTVSDTSQLQPLVASTSSTDTRGRGLRLVAAFTRQWGVTQDDRHTKSVWADFDVVT
jgi:anti-sigma regulatory factor (Ser/Thr protein kinase)